MKLEDIKSKILKANKDYSLGKPTMEDGEYDKLRAKARALGEEVTTTVPVVGKAIKHTEPMPSMRDVFNIEECLKFLPVSDEYDIEAKLDGASMEVNYVDGILTTAQVRGDGKQGEAVNFPLAIEGVPKIITVQSKVAIRGEVIISKKNFLKFNKDGEYSNPRNLVAGRMRTTDENKLKSIHAEFIPWDIIVGGLHLTTKEIARLSKDNGLIRNPINLRISSREEIEPTYLNTIDIRDSIKYDIDGLAVKVASIEERSEIGETSKFPKWSVAFKFPAELKKTVCTDVTFDIGRTGVYTPVCVYKPVEVGGVTLTHGTLHNHYRLKSIGIGIGSSISVARNGDVIPQVIAVHSKGSPVNIPVNCAYCGTKLVIEGYDLKCPNDSCVGQMAARIVNFAKRDYMGIKGLGPSSVDKLMEAGLVSTYSDLYKLSQDDLTDLLGANGNSIYLEIQNSIGKPIELLLGSITIENGGRSIFSKIVDAGKLYGSIEELKTVRGISTITAESIHKTLLNNTEIAELIKLAKPVESEPITKTFFITGVFEQSRKEIEDEMFKLGYKKTGSFKADIALVGQSASEKKIKKLIANKVDVFKSVAELKDLPWN